MDDKLIQLSQQSNLPVSDVRQGMRELYVQFLREREKALLDAVMASAALGAVVANPEGLTPQMEEAFHLAFPHLDLADVADYQGEEWAGLLSAWKGKYFEVLVRDKLNAGEPVGEIQLEEGQYAALADSPTQEGWDLRIWNPDGSIAQDLQLKATDSLGYVKEAIERYPDIQVLTTDEVLEDGHHLIDQILSSGISNQELTTELSAAAAAAAHGTWAEVADVLLPGLPFLIIAIGEGRRVLVGQKSLELAIADGLERGWKTGAAMSVGALVAWMDGGLLSVPATLLTRLGIDRYQLLKRVRTRMIERTQQVIELRPRYGC